MPTATKTKSLKEFQAGSAGNGLAVVTEADYSARNNGGRKGSLEHLDIERIKASPLNPRKYFDDSALQELAESIRKQGLLQPIAVRIHGKAMFDGAVIYEVIAGERRWRASKLAGLDSIPAFVFTDINDDELLELALIENLIRRDLDPIEEANGYRSLANLGYTQTQIAEKVNRSQPTIANRLRLLDLPEEVRKGVTNGEISPSAAEVLASMKDVPPAAVALIGKMAVEYRIPLAKLEKHELDYRSDNAIRESKLAKDLTRAKFDWQKICSACPFKAKWVSSSWGGWCLKPEHYKELQGPALLAEKEERRLEEERNAEAARKAGVDIPDGGKVPPYNWNTMCEISNVPAGCTTDCACRGIALDPYGTKKIKKVCTNKKRFQDLQQKEKAQKTLARRDRAQKDLDQACLALASINPLESGPLSQVASSVFRHTDTDLVRPLIEGNGGKYKSADLAASLATLAPENLIRVALRVIVLQEHRERCEGWRGDQARHEVTTWLAKQAPKTPAAKKTAADRDTHPDIATSIPTESLSVEVPLQTLNFLANAYDQDALESGLLASAPTEYGGSLWFPVYVSGDLSAVHCFELLYSDKYKGSTRELAEVAENLVLGQLPVPDLAGCIIRFGKRAYVLHGRETVFTAEEVTE